MLRSATTAVLAAGFAFSLSSAVVTRRPNPAPRRAQTARDVVLASAEAIGGIDRLRALRGVRVEEVGSEYLVSTITRGDAPPRVISETVTTLRSGNDSVLRRTLVQAVPMRAGRFTTTTIVNRGVPAAIRGTALVMGANVDLTTASEELALSPERVLLTALDARDLRLGRDTVRVASRIASCR